MAELKHQIPVNAAPAKVYAAIATQAGLRGWWTADSTADEKVGGKAEFGFGRTIPLALCTSSFLLTKLPIEFIANQGL